MYMHLPRNVTTLCSNADFSEYVSVSMYLFGNNMQHNHSIMKEICYVVFFINFLIMLIK